VRAWPMRRCVVAAISAVATVVLVGVPTALIPSPAFGRGVPAPGWAWPVLLVTALLSGLVTATYVARPGMPGSVSSSATRGGVVGGVLSYLAVGCPSCNKIALLALGSTGAVRWFAPVQPDLAVAGLGVLAYALRRRLAGERACPLPRVEASTPTD
jgi:hypothetical protein